MEIEGIIVQNSPYQEADLIVSVLTERGLVTFKARGVRKLESHNRSVLFELALGRFELLEGKGGLLLKRGTLLFQPKTDEDLDALALLGLIKELNARLLSEEDAAEMYPYLKKTILGFQGDCEPYSLTLSYFAKVLKKAGYGLNVDACVLCGSKTGIIGLSYTDGGFVCTRCRSHSDTRLLDALELKIVRYIFKVDLDRFQSITFEKEKARHLLFVLQEFLLEASGLSLKSLTLLGKIGKKKAEVHS